MSAYRGDQSNGGRAVPRGPLGERYEQLSSDVLLDMVLRHPGDYTEEALGVVRAVLATRGLDVEREKHRRDEQADRERERADQERAARDEATRALAEAARKLGACCACRKAAPEVELHVLAWRPLIGLATPVGGGMSTSSQAVLLAVPVCRACEPAWRLPTALARVWFAVAAVGMLAGEAALVALVPYGWLGAYAAKLVVLAPWAVGIFGIWWIDAARQGRRDAAARRLANLHPAHAALREGAFLFVPPEQMGRSKVETLASRLEDPDFADRPAVEEQLARCPGSDVVAALRSRLDHPVAAVHAIRALGALRAHDAIEDLRRVARSGPPAASEEAKAVLATLLDGEPR